MRPGPATGRRLVTSALVMGVGAAAVLLAANHRGADGGSGARRPAATEAPNSPARGARRGPSLTEAATSRAEGADGAATAAADSFVLAYAGYDWRHPAGDPSAWRGFAAPELYTQLTGPSGSGPGMTPAQVARHEVAVPRLRSTTWGSGTATTATVLVDCLLTVDSDQGPTQQQDVPYPLTLVDRGGTWLVSSVDGTGPGQ